MNLQQGQPHRLQGNGVPVRPAPDVEGDDTLYIPAGAEHSYEVLEAPFEFRCVVPNAPDEIRLKESC